MRLVRHMCNEKMQVVTNTWVKIERKRRVAQFVMNTCQLFDTIEYDDGSYLDVYYNNGEFIGIEYNDECRFVG